LFYDLIGAARIPAEYKECVLYQQDCFFPVVILQAIYHSLSKIRPTPFSLKVTAKGQLLLKSTPTQQTKIICSSMHSDEIHSVHVYVG